MAFSKVVLLDFSNIGYATYHAIKNSRDFENDEEMVDYWRRTMLQVIKKNKGKHDPDEFIVLTDSMSWRKKVFPFYKAKREELKKKEDYRYQFFIENMVKFIEEMQEYMPFKTLNIKGAEADDLIAILAIELQQVFDRVVISSNDKDFRQLLNKKVHLWDMRQQKWIQIEDPQEFLVTHILSGDNSDGIPNVRSEDDVFIDEKKRQKPCGAKTIAKILESGLNEWLEEGGDENRKRNYQRNKKLIELSRNTIPKGLWKVTMEKYNSLSERKVGYNTVLKYFAKKGLRNMVPEIRHFM